MIIMKKKNKKYKRTKAVWKPHVSAERHHVCAT